MTVAMNLEGPAAFPFLWEWHSCLWMGGIQLTLNFLEKTQSIVIRDTRGVLREAAVELSDTGDLLHA